MNDTVLGLKPGDLNVIIEVLARFPGIVKASVFGSRAKGNYQNGSDIDIVVWSENKQDALSAAGILNDETLLPYKLDILNYDQINNADLKEHIDRRGIVIYQKP